MKRIKKIAAMFLLLCSPVLLAKYDFVAELKLNDMDLIKADKVSQASKMLSGSITKMELWFNECTSNYEITADYEGKNLNLEFIQSINESVELDKLLSKMKVNETSLEKAPLKELNAYISLGWNDMHTFTESLQVGEHRITPNLTETEFSRLFPKSYSQKADWGENGENIYHVLYGSTDVIKANNINIEELAPDYDPMIQFVFKEGKLIRLFVSSGDSC